MGAAEHPQDDMGPRIQSNGERDAYGRHRKHPTMRVPSYCREPSGMSVRTSIRGCPAFAGYRQTTCSILHGQNASMVVRVLRLNIMPCKASLVDFGVRDFLCPSGGAKMPNVFPLLTCL